ncbi:MAG: phosphoribosylanthranilate isomerase [Pyrinomonadaceae bacterium]|nr:phosphoribosylanthranilate isomerase [Pyrinomonadaceae bacterium]
MTKVKICGITNLEDALLSVKFGADALGFNFYEKSPRYIAPENVREIIEQLPQEVLKVGVFVNEELEKIPEIAEIAKLDALQLHGEETPEFARELKQKTNLEIIKAFRVSPDFAPEDVLKYETDAILLDAYSPKEHGGTGETFDWEIAKKVQEIFPKMYLAGGITHNNVLIATNGVNGPKAFGVDVCSGVEKEKGKKDRIKLINLLTKVKNDLKEKTKEFIEYKTIYQGSLGKCKKTENIYELLGRMHARPSLHFGEKSLSKLQFFLSGFWMALNFSNSNFDMKKFGSEEYRRWMSKKVGYCYPNTFDCITHILRKFDYDEEQSFDYFFALLEEFKLENENSANK